jgi:hypothetical protein
MPEAVSVAGTAVTVVLLRLKAVLLPMLATVGFCGFVVRPEAAMPTASPVVLAVFTVGLVPGEQPVSVTPAAVSVRELPVPVASRLRMNSVALLICEIVVLAGMFVPVINIPGIRPAVLAQVTDVVPFVAQFVRTMGAV